MASAEKPTLFELRSQASRSFNKNSKPIMSRSPANGPRAISTVSTSRKRHPWALIRVERPVFGNRGGPLSLGSGKFLCATSPLPAWRPVVPIIIRCGTPSCDSENHGAILPSHRIGSARNLGIQTGPNGRLPLDLLGAASTFAIV